MKRYAVILFTVGLLLASGCSTSRVVAPLPGGQSAQSFSREIRTTVSAKYYLYVPDGYGIGDREWPLVLFLHGSGERGTDLNRVKVHGPPKLVDLGKKFPFILVSPQCPDDEEWSTDMLGALLDEVEGHYAVDKNRVYVTGLSMGGYGTWKLGMTFPDRFAALAPICGGGSGVNICSLKNVPVRAYHGKLDPVVPIEEEEKLVKRLQACGGHAELIVYPEAGHDAWTATYNDPAFYDWLLSQSLHR
jgi:predicted peptidase